MDTTQKEKKLRAEKAPGESSPGAFFFERRIKTEMNHSNGNRDKARVEKASHTVRVGDVLTMTLNRRVRVFKVTGLGQRRGPSAAARSLYEELTATVDAPKPHAQSTLPIPSPQHDAMGPGRRAAGRGRPTKKERRDIDRLNAKNR